MTSLATREFLDRLRDLPVTYDIVIGDFGREAAARYIALLAQEERLFLAPMLRSHGLTFFDEYRRIMFAHVGDLAFLKSAMITREWTTSGHMTDEVLVAVKEHEVPHELVSRIASVIRDEALLAAQRGYRRVRVSLPCNALSESLEQSTQIAGKDIAASAEARSLSHLAVSPATALPELTAHGVVQSALREMVRMNLFEKGPFVVLGAGMAREQYLRLGGDLGMSVLPLTATQQEIIDKAVLACIDGSTAEQARTRAEITDAIIAPLRRKHSSLQILEACTDFDLRLGLDSVRLMAKHMIHECYATLSERQYE